MRITTDTNVLLSATFWNGASDKILQKVEKNEIELVLSMNIISELARVLEYSEIKEKIKNKNLEMKRTVEKIVSLSTIVEPDEYFNLITEDPDDNKLLECAKAGNVNYRGL